MPYFPAEVKEVANLQGGEAGLRRKGNRCKEFVSKIKSLPPEFAPDVICLQEVWENKYKKSIRRKLSDLYPYSYLDLTETYEAITSGIFDADLKYLNSGLMILSRFEITKNTMLHYNNSVSIFQGSEDGLAMKGMLGVTLKFPDSDYEFHVFSTHLQSQSNNKANNAKLGQLNEARKKIRSHTKHNGDGIIIVGDFNLSKEKHGGEDNDFVFERAMEVFSSEEYPDIVDTYAQDAAERAADTYTASSWESVLKYLENNTFGNGGYHKIDQAWILTDKAAGFSYISCFLDDEENDGEAEHVTNHIVEQTNDEGEVELVVSEDLLSDHLQQLIRIEILDPYKTINAMADHLVDSINGMIPGYIESKGYDPMASVASSRTTLGKIKLAPKIKAKATADYSIKNLRGLSSIRITEIIIDEVNYSDTEVNGTLFLSGVFDSDLKADVTGKIEAKAAGVKEKVKIKGTAIAKGARTNGNGYYSASLSIRQSSLDDVEVTRLQLNWSNLKVNISGLGFFNKYLNDVEDLVESLYISKLKSAITDSVLLSVNRVIDKNLPLIF
jgi:endonuclease/exonuclease/phosphatase family metal-dependent hydrolase